MTSKLQQIENEISKTNASRETMTAELTNLAAKVNKQLAEQEALILAGKDSSKVENDLMASQIRERGVRKVLSTLDETLTRLENELRSETRLSKLSEAAKVKAEMLKLGYEMMAHVRSANELIKPTRQKLIQYQNDLRTADVSLRDPQIETFTYVLESLPELVEQTTRNFDMETLKINMPVQTR